MVKRTFPLARDAYTGRPMGRYEVLCALSEGGMASLYLGVAKGAAGFRKLVVLKRVLPEFAGNADFLRRFLDEAKVMAELSHPNIAQVFDLGQEGKDYFLAMEFVTGASLLELVAAASEEQKPLPLGLGLAVARDTALALHYAHTYVDPLGRSRPILHRDVAPKNVMVTYEGSTKLLDFGVAKVHAANLTGAGIAVGTPGYMAPEQALGKVLDARADVFGLGITLFEGITGKRLFARATPDDELVAPLQTVAPAPSSLNPKIPAAVDAVLLRALAPKKEDRFPTALAFGQALDALGPAMLWPPDQRGAWVLQTFGERRAQTRQLLEVVRDAADVTELDLDSLVTEPSLPRASSPLPRPAERELERTEQVLPARRRFLLAAIPLAAVAAVATLAILLPSRESEHALSGDIDAGMDAGR